MNNFIRVEEMVKDVKLRDSMRAFQSPVKGAEIMEAFDLKPGKDVGKIKAKIEEAILDGEIENNYDAAYKFMMNLKKTIT